MGIEPVEKAESEAKVGAGISPKLVMEFWACGEGPTRPVQPVPSPHGSPLRRSLQGARRSGQRRRAARPGLGSSDLAKGT